MLRSFVELSLNVPVVVALLVVIAHTESQADVCRNIHAEYNPKNGLRRGANYTVSCLFDNIPNSCDIKSMTFALWNKTDINPKIHNMSDGSGIYVNMTGAEPKHRSSFPFECQWNNHSVDSAKFMIGELLEVKDFDCNSIFYGESDIDCSFTRPEKSYDADPRTTYKLYLVEKGEKLAMCKTNATDPLVRCKLSGKSYIPNIDGTLSFRLVMKDFLGEQDQIFSVDQKDMAIPIRAGINTTRLNLTKNSICLKWENKNKIDNVTWQVHIMEEPEWQLNRNFSWKELNASPLEEAYCLVGLPHPYREYTLNVTRKFEKGKRWSKPFIYKFTTESDIPSRPPKLWDGGYQYIDENHQLIVYWQQLDHLERNGPNFTNQVSVRNLGDQTEVENLKIFVEANWATIDNLPTGGGQYEILVHSQNSRGKSSNSSSIRIGQLEKSAQRRPKLIERNKDKGQISWPAPENAPALSHYMVFWCIENESNHNLCLNSTRIAAEKVPKNRTYYANPNITNDSFKWAVSAIDGEVSGGMVWYTVHGEQTTTSTAFRGVEGVVALLIIGGFGYLAYRKFRDCSDIEIEFPPGVFSNRDNKDNEQHPMLSIPDRSLQSTDIPFPGSVIPGTPPLGLPLTTTPGTPPLEAVTLGTPSDGLPTVPFPAKLSPVIASGTDPIEIFPFALPDTPSGYVIPTHPAKPDTLGLSLSCTPDTPPLELPLTATLGIPPHGSATLGTNSVNLLALTFPDELPPVIYSHTSLQTPSGYVIPARLAKPDILGGYVHVDTVKAGSLSNTLPITALPGTPSHALPQIPFPVACDYVLPLTGMADNPSDEPIVSASEQIKFPSDDVAMKVLASRTPASPRTVTSSPPWARIPYIK